MAYLRQTGWAPVADGADEKWRVFTRSIDAGPVRLEVPLLSEATNYDRAVEELLHNLELLERRAMSAILVDISGSSQDRVRIGVRGPTTAGGRVDVATGARIYNAARDLVLAAACSTIEARAVYGRRKPEAAMEYLRTASFGQSEVGSYVLTVETSIPPRLLGASDAADPDPPFERRVTLVFAEAVAAARAALAEAAATASIEPFRRHVEHGVSANLCEALSGLSVPGHSLALSFALAPVRPAPQPATRTIEFGADAGDLLHEAAKRLRAESPWADAEIEGPILKLESADPTQGGDVLIVAEIEGRMRRVRVHRDQASYQTALAAHGGQRIVRCRGELVREGIALVLRNATDFSFVADDNT
jgi:hypothetical protein